jgi:hypothetical protein
MGDCEKPNQPQYGDRTARVLKLRDYPDGVQAGLRSHLCAGRAEIVSVGADSSLALIGGDPWNTNVYTGLQVPSTPTAALAALSPDVPPSQLRYLFLLARAQFNSGDVGTRLTGIRLYAELVATIPGGATFHREIIHPLFRPPDGSITWHVMVIPKTQMARKNVNNADTFIFRDSYGPALLYETPFPAYVPPNGARPWGKPIGASLGNMHDLRYRWRYSDIEQTLDIPLPLPCDVALFASVRQNDPATNPSDVGKPAVVGGNVDLTTLTLPGALAGETLDITVNGTSDAITFGAPATVADVLAEINAVISPTATATTNAQNYLVITTAANGFAQTLQPTASSALATLGLSAMAAPATGVNALTADQFAALEHEEKFLTAFSAYAQYGRIAGSLVFDQNLGENVP